MNLALDRRLVVALVATVIIACTRSPDEVDRLAEVLELRAPVEIEDLQAYADGGTISARLIDAEGRAIIFGLDGRPDIWRASKRLFLGAFRPEDVNAVHISICSDTEGAIYDLLADYIDRTYPDDWLDPDKYAFTGVGSIVKVLAARSCWEDVISNKALQLTLDPSVPFAAAKVPAASRAAELGR